MRILRWELAMLLVTAVLAAGIFFLPGEEAGVNVQYGTAAADFPWQKINNDEEVSGYTLEYDCDDNALQEYGLPVHKSWSIIHSHRIDCLSYLKEKDADIVPLIIDIAPLDFERMVRNIIENARTHGFTNPKRDDYFIGIDLTVNAERDMFQIDFSNNGTPLPKGIDKSRYGLLGEKAGITGGTGRGGYVVKSIVEHYHGDYDIFMDGERTVVRILLPISKQYGE